MAHYANDYFSRRSSKVSSWRSTANCTTCDCKRFSTEAPVMAKVLQHVLSVTDPLERQTVNCPTCGMLRKSPWEPCGGCGEVD